MEKVLPKGWVETEFSDLVSFVIGGDWGKDEEFGEEGYSIVHCIRGSEIKNWNENYGSTAVLRKLKVSSIVTRELQVNDILLEISGGGPDQPVGRTVLIDQNVFSTLIEHPIVCTNFLRLVRPIKNISSKFLNSYLHYFYISGQIANYQGGSNNLRNLRYKEFETIKIPFPPLAEQERIVAKLDALFAQHEKIKSALARIPQLLKDFRKQVLTQAVTGKLTEQWREGKDLESADFFIQKVISDRNENDRTLKRKLTYESIEGSYEIPEKWCFSFLQNLGEFTRGKSKHRPRNDKKLFNGEYPFIQTGDVSNATMYINEYKNTYSEFGLKQSRLFPKGTLCITIAANIAETAILNFDSCFPDSVVGYVPYKNFYSSEFAMYFINTIQKELEHYAPATAQKNINMAILGEIPFPIPPLQEQREIIYRVESLFAKADAIESRYHTLKAKIEALPQAILHKAFKGELVPQLPTDGDAKDLLAEIMALKKEITGKKKQK